MTEEERIDAMIKQSEVYWQSQERQMAQYSFLIHLNSLIPVNVP